MAYAVGGRQFETFSALQEALTAKPARFHSLRELVKYARGMSDYASLRALTRDIRDGFPAIATPQELLVEFAVSRDSTPPVTYLHACFGNGIRTDPAEARCCGAQTTLDGEVHYVVRENGHPFVSKDKPAIDLLAMNNTRGIVRITPQGPVFQPGIGASAWPGPEIERRFYDSRIAAQPGLDDTISSLVR